MFVERAQSADPSLLVGEEDRDLLVRLCSQLDGMPLAIELAAARVRSMTLGDLVERLPDRFRLLRGSRRSGADSRQQTLLATIEWSYQLLDVDEQLVFDRLSVFAGSFDLDAAQEVCADDDISNVDIADLLDSLVDRSMIQVDRSAPRARFTLLETMRQFGLDRLTGRGEVDGLRDRHLAHFVNIAAEARACFEGARNRAGRELFELEWDNLRAALEHAEASGDEQSANRLVRDPFWYAFVQPRDEHNAWTQRRASRLKRLDPEVLGSAALWVYINGDYAESERLSRVALSAAPTPDHPSALLFAWVLAATVFAWPEAGTRDDAYRLDLAAKRVASASDDRFSAAIVTAWAGPMLAVAPQDAPGQVAAGRAIVEELDNDSVGCILSGYAANAAFAIEDYATMRAEYELGIELGERSGNHMYASLCLALLASRSASLDDDPEEMFREAVMSLPLQAAILYWALTGLAGWWASIGDITRAAHVIGFLDRYDPTGHPTVADLRGHATDLRGHATELVHQHPDAALWRSEGASMGREEMVEYCLQQLDRSQ